MTLHVRSARPGDAGHVVPLMHESSRGLIDATFGRDAADVLYRDFVAAKGLFGYRNQIVGVTPSGEIAATLTMYEGRRYRRLSLYTLLSAAHLGPARLGGAVRRTMAMSALFTPPRPDGLFVANLCVVRERRGTGCGSALIRYAIGSASARGLRSVELDVSFSNVRAQRLYERLGFTVTGENSAPDGSLQDGFRRMALPLDPPASASTHRLGRPRSAQADLRHAPLHG
jgi:GNAT superfamily N-acetyltransferase